MDWLSYFLVYDLGHGAANLHDLPLHSSGIGNALDIGELLKTGLAAQRDGRFDAAESTYAITRQRWPNNADVWYLSAILAHTRLDLRNAKSFVERALSIDPAFALAHNTAGIIAKDMGDFDAALVHFSEALRYNPELAEVYANESDLLRLFEKAAGRRERGPSRYHLKS